MTSESKPPLIAITKSGLYWVIISPRQTRFGFDGLVRGGRVQIALTNGGFLLDVCYIDSSGKLWIKKPYFIKNEENKK